MEEVPNFDNPKQLVHFVLKKCANGSYKFKESGLFIKSQIICDYIYYLDFLLQKFFDFGISKLEICVEGFDMLNGKKDWLKNMSELRVLNLHNRRISEIPELPDSLEVLYCGGGTYFCNSNEPRLTELPELPKNLRKLYCFDNILTKLPKLPPNLTHLCCSNNKLTELPELPKTLKKLSCESNYIKVIKTNSILYDCYINGNSSYSGFIYDSNTKIIN